MDAALTISYQVVIMFILMAFGFMCYKFRIISNNANKQLSNFVSTVVNAVLLFVSFQKEFNQKLVNGLLIALVLAVISHALLIAFSMIFIKKKGNPDWGIERFAAAYSNCGFMGIPLIHALYGTDGIFFLTAYITVINILTWTHGVIMLREDKDLKSIINALKSPAIIAIALGFIFFMFQIFLPDIVMAPLNYIASLITPLAMIVSGVTIAQTNIFKAFKKLRIYLVVALKQLIVPIIALIIFKQFNISETVLNSIVIATACPVATMTIMFGYKFKKDVIYASEMFAISTLLSVVTLPIILLFSSIL